jgi:hypothetical protein
MQDKTALHFNIIPLTARFFDLCFCSQLDFWMRGKAARSGKRSILNSYVSISATRLTQHIAKKQAAYYLRDVPMANPDMIRSRNIVYKIATGMLAISAPPMSGPQKKTSPLTSSVVMPMPMVFFAES